LSFLESIDELQIALIKEKPCPQKKTQIPLAVYLIITSSIAIAYQSPKKKKNWISYNFL
jgi:hypothetical protein